MKRNFTFLVLVTAGLIFTGLQSCCDTNSKESNSKVQMAQKNADGIYEVNTAEQFEIIVSTIADEKNALFVFDIDNTLLITNDNKFGSDWWFSQASKSPDLKLNISDSCLYSVLTPLFYAVYDTRPVFPGQATQLDKLEKKGSKTIALTSRGYTPVNAVSTELELKENSFDFMDQDSASMANGVILLNDIIYTAGKNKGDALMEYITENPHSAIYYFDDSMHKVEDVQEAFKGSSQKIELYHMKIAPKIPYTSLEKAYMKKKLCNLIESVNNVGSTNCRCKNP